MEVCSIIYINIGDKYFNQLTKLCVDFYQSSSKCGPLNCTMFHWMIGLKTAWFPIVPWNDLFSRFMWMKTTLDISVIFMCSHVHLLHCLCWANYGEDQRREGLKNSFVKSSITAKMYYTVNQYACCCLDFHVLERQGNPFIISLWWHSLGFNVGLCVLSHIGLPSFYCNSHFSSFYQLLIKSERKRGHFHKYANTRSRHHRRLHSHRLE